MFAFIAAGTIAAALAALDVAPARVTPLVAPVPRAGNGAAAEHKIYGFVQSLTGTTLIVKTRSGAPLVVDTRLAHASLRVFPGRAVIVFGSTDANGIVRATRVWRTFPDAAHWPADR